MPKRILLNSELLDITIKRLCQQLSENHGDFSNSVILGLQPRGIYLAKRIQSSLKTMFAYDVPLGHLDVTFHRDDFRRREILQPNRTHVPFLIEEKNVILIDDVLFTGRTINAALSAMQAFGRPKHVELLVLIDRKYSRDIPIEPDYSGKSVNTIQSQRVQVEWKEQGADEDNIWLISAE